MTLDNPPLKYEKENVGTQCKSVPSKILILCSTYRIAKYVMKIKITNIVILMNSDLTSVS